MVNVSSHKQHTKGTFPMDSFEKKLVVFALALLIIGVVTLLSAFPERVENDLINLSPEENRMMEDLKTAEPGDFIRWKDGSLTVIVVVFAEDQVVLVRDPQTQCLKKSMKIDEVLGQIVFVCKRNSDPVIWEKLCVEYVLKIPNLPSSATQPEK
jgi:hypothetical protein